MIKKSVKTRWQFEINHCCARIQLFFNADPCPHGTSCLFGAELRWSKSSMLRQSLTFEYSLDYVTFRVMLFTFLQTVQTPPQKKNNVRHISCNKNLAVGKVRTEQRKWSLQIFKMKIRSGLGVPYHITLIVYIYLISRTIPSSLHL